MVRIRRFSVIRTASVVALMDVIAIAVIGIPIVLLIAVAGISVPSDGTPPVGAVGGGLFAVVGFVGLLFIAAIYAILGWIFTALACLLYNAAARFTGGIEIEVERFGATPPLPPVPDWVPPAAPPWPGGGAPGASGSPSGSSTGGGAPAGSGPTPTVGG